jgi:hypothetical protein
MHHAPLSPLLQHVPRLAGREATRGLTDRQLLHRLQADRDEVASRISGLQCPALTTVRRLR